MEVIHERCAGLDVHKETVVRARPFFCKRVSGPGSSRREKSEKLALSVPGEWQLSL